MTLSRPTEARLAFLMLCSTIKFQLVLQLIESGGANRNRASEPRASEKMSGEQSAFLQMLQRSPKLDQMFQVVLPLIESSGANENQASDRMSGEHSAIFFRKSCNIPRNQENQITFQFCIVQQIFLYTNILTDVPGL